MSLLTKVKSPRPSQPKRKETVAEPSVGSCCRIGCGRLGPMRFRESLRRLNSECSHQLHSKRPRTPIHIPAFNTSSILLTSSSCGPYIGPRPRFKSLRQVSASNQRLRGQLSFCSFPLLHHPPSSTNSQQRTGRPHRLHLVERRTASIHPIKSSFTPLRLPKTINPRAIRLRSAKSSHLKPIRTATAVIDSALVFPSELTAFMALSLDLNHSDVTLTGTIIAIVFGWLALWQILTSQQIVPSIATRKIFHLTCGPAFVALWPLYSNFPTARLTAASVPLLFIALLVISGLSADENASGPRGVLGRMLSRGGNARDALQGPLYYTLVLLALTMLLFKSVIAAIAVTQLCFGDAMAEIVGRRFGSKMPWPIPGTGNKSVSGSFAFVLAALIGSVLAIEWYHYWNCSSLQIDDLHIFMQLAIISVACSAAELGSTIVSLDDNLTISTVAVILCIFMFGAQV